MNLDAGGDVAQVTKHEIAHTFQRQVAGGYTVDNWLEEADAEELSLTDQVSIERNRARFAAGTPIDSMNGQREYNAQAFLAYLHRLIDATSGAGSYRRVINEIYPSMTASGSGTNELITQALASRLERLPRPFTLSQAIAGYYAGNPRAAANTITQNLELSMARNLSADRASADITELSPPAGTDHAWIRLNLRRLPAGTSLFAVDADGVHDLSAGGEVTLRWHRSVPFRTPGSVRLIFANGATRAGVPGQTHQIGVEITQTRPRDRSEPQLGSNGGDSSRRDTSGSNTGRNMMMGAAGAAAVGIAVTIFQTAADLYGEGAIARRAAGSAMREVRDSVVEEIRERTGVRISVDAAEEAAAEAAEELGHEIGRALSQARNGLFGFGGAAGGAARGGREGRAPSGSRQPSRPRRPNSRRQSNRTPCGPTARTGRFGHIAAAAPNPCPPAPGAPVRPTPTPQTQTTPPAQETGPGAPDCPPSPGTTPPEEYERLSREPGPIRDYFGKDGHYTSYCLTLAIPPSAQAGCAGYYWDSVDRVWRSGANASGTICQPG